MDTPIQNAFCLPVKCEHLGLSAVPHLLTRGGPSAIIGLVVSIIVDSVDGKPLLIRGAHVIQKVLKFLPPITHYNPATSIQIVVLRFGIVASIFHVLPDIVKSSSPFRGLFRASTMLQTLKNTTHATAGSRLTVSKSSSVNHSDFPANASAFPVSGCVPLFFYWPKYSEVSEYLSCVILEFYVTTTYLFFSLHIEDRFGLRSAPACS